MTPTARATLYAIIAAALAAQAVLGINVALIGVALSVLLYLVNFGFKVAEHAFDAFESGCNVNGLRLICAALVLSVGGGFVLAWLIFGSGLVLSRP